MAKAAPKEKNAADDSLPFEEAIAELESIVKEMESERLPLDKLVERYERGSALLQTCQKRLKEAEQRIELIASGKSASNDSEKEASLEPFKPDASGTDKSPSKSKPASSPGDPSSDKPDEISLF